MRASSSARRGIVLVAVILFLAVLALAITTATLIAAQADASARARADGIRARLAAESAARSAAGAWDVTTVRGLSLLQERPLSTAVALPGRARAQAAVRRVGPDLFLIVGQGAAGQTRARAGMLVSVLSVAALLVAFPAAIASGGGTLESTARVSVSPPTEPPPGWRSLDCDPAAADSLLAVFGDPARPGVLASGRVEAAGAAIAGTPPVAAGPPISFNGLGPLSWEALPALADLIETGTITLAPVVLAGGCDRTAPGNWGEPRDPTSPCAGYLPLIYAPGDLRIAGGAGQGVLVIRGHLVLDGGAEFYGPIIAAGGVEAGVGARIWGAVSATPVQWAGAVTYSACTILRALSSAPGLGRPFRAGQRLWARIF